ncbi:MAG: multiple sugar transport system ATP-binding protein [Gaiellaceae bacterium]|jgi:multiple sugar transport system ATP-binding protein|nr:multiple sugar transport system ATP-binding protein [Gaiellaceae bacterium]
MADVLFDGIEKVYENGVRAVQDLSLEIADGEFLVLVGPSGCGKTTALRMVAGLEEISDGTLSIGGRVVNDLTPKERDIAMVFQSYALYPHLSVAENIAFGLRLRKTNKDVISERVAWAAKMLDLTPYLDRRPKQLSGGQRQRVAMGRAIVRHPQVFLMDEPLSNLDAKLRVQMRADISKLQRDLGTTTVYVTHDQVEAMTMGDRVAVMNQGLLQQVDTPQRLYDQPANLFVAGFIGTPPMNLIEADVSVDGDDVSLVIGGQRLPAPDAALKRYPALRGAGGRRVVVGLRAGDLHLARDRPDLPTLTARLELVEVLGSESIAYFRIDAMAIRPEGVDEETDDEMDGQGVTAARPNFVASVPAESAYGLEIDTDVPIAVDAAKLHAFDQESGEPLR